MIVEIIIILVVVLFSAFFSGIELALFSLSHVKVRHMLNNHVPGADLIRRLKAKPNKLLVTILVGNNIVNIAGSAFATVVAIELFGSYGAGIATGFMTFIILIFGEMLPKALANRFPQRFALVGAPLIRFFTIALYPIILFFEAILTLILKLFKARRTPVITEEELLTMLEVSAEEGAVEHEEKEMIERVLDFNDITAKEVMTRAENVAMLKSDLSIDKAIDYLVSASYSRMPVYRDNKKNVVGILTLKDALKAEAQEGNHLLVADIMQKPLIVYENKIIDELLKEFQKEKKHMAIVLSADDGFVGIITLEDLLEEIVGEIVDEEDVIDNYIMRLDKDVVLANGKTRVLDLEHFLKIPLSRNKGQALSRLISQKIGTAHRGSRIDLDHCLLEVVEIKDRKITKVRITVKEGEQ